VGVWGSASPRERSLRQEEIYRSVRTQPGCVVVVPGAGTDETESTRTRHVVIIRSMYLYQVIFI
jgi:hypothetical protein